jgi:uncharacterized protein (DUF305 family)
MRIKRTTPYSDAGLVRLPERRGPVRVAIASLATLSLFTLAACGNDDAESGDSTENGRHGMSSMMKDDDSASADASAEHNNADVRFAQQMIPHHAQAVAMAQMAESHAESDEVRALAADIEAAQGPEIELMSGWLESWSEDVPATGMGHGAASDNMHDMGGTDDMPGMMSGEDMESLDGAHGRGFDRMFLEMMIEHHEGAIEMARTEQADGQYPDAVALAKTIEKVQAAEIATMQELLGS